MAEEIKKVIEIDTSKSTKSIKQLRQEVAALTDEIENLEIGSSEYTDKVENLVKVQGDLNVATESMQGTTVNSIKVFDSLNQIAGGLAGGISAVSATFTLFGKDNENLQKTMVKLQAAIAIVQGISGLKGLGEGVLKAITSFKALTVSMNASAVGTKGLTVAMKGLKAALVSTGIGALIVGLGILIEKLMSATEETENLEDAVDALQSKMSGFYGSVDQWGNTYANAMRNIIGLERERDKALAEGTLPELQVWQDYSAKLTEEANKVQTAFGQVSQAYNKGVENLIISSSYWYREWRELYNQNGTSLTQFVESMLWELQTSSTFQSDFYKTLTDAEKQVFDQLTQDYQAELDARDTILQKQSDTVHQVQIMEIKAARDAREAQAEEYKKRIEARQDYNRELLKTINDFYEDNKRTLMSDETLEIYELRQKYQKQIDALIEAKELELITEEQYEERILQVHSAYDDEYLEILNNRYQEEIEARLAAVQEMIDRESQLWANKEAALQASRKTYTTNVYDVGLFAKEGESYQSKQNIEDEYAATIAYNEQLFNLTKDRIERENELLFDQQDILKEMLNNSLITQEEYFNQVQGLQLQQEANDIALSNARNQREEADLRAFQERQDKKQQAVEATFQVASSLAGAAANIAKAEANNEKKTEKERARAFKVYKALATTQAIIDTVSSAQSAYKSMVGIPYVGPFLAPIAAAAAVALGIANIRSIQQETMPTAAGGSESVTAPSALNTPPIEYTRNLLGDKETESLNQPVKCYVLESDITDTQNKVAVTESNASF